MEEGFDAFRENAHPYLSCGFDEGDGAEVVEGDVFVFFWDGVEKTPFPGGGALPVRPEIGEVAVEL